MSYSGDSLICADVKCSCRGYNLDKLLQPSILTLLAHRELHGYMIIQELENRSLSQGEGADHAGIYRTLKILEDKGLVSSEWDTEGTGAARKIYKINDAGRECLANWVRTLEDYKKTIDAIISEARSAAE